jgi:transcriptional regulator with GAF, ATPase, and Fis domain
LIDASATKELLLQELAAVVYENFPALGVVIFRGRELNDRQLLAFQGMDRGEAESLMDALPLLGLDKVKRLRDGYLFEVAGTVKKGIVLYVRSTGGVDVARLQGLFRPVDLGLEACSLRTSVKQAIIPKEENKVRTVMPGFIIGSSIMFEVIDKIHKIRTSDVTVLITGESGTGKELVARSIHAECARARAVFLPFNCTATPKEIIDSHLFGHRRGAFTGATANYPGIIRAAEGGTLFLDEIGDLSLEVQPKLMRFLQEGEIQPLGEMRPIKVDVRIIAATNSDLERAVEDGRFREDLFHRLNIIRIHVPPLRDRPEEVPVLACHFLEHFSTRSGKAGLVLTQDALDALSAYNWPGNVRQLRNEIERVVAYAAEGQRVGADDFSPDVSHRRSRIFDKTSSGIFDSEPRNRRGVRSISEPSVKVPVKLKVATAMLEKQLIEEALLRNNRNLSRTAVELGLSRRGLRLKLTQLGIVRDGPILD